MQRNYSIDSLKFVCAFLVVLLHTDCAFHYALLPLTKCAVPCFFIISGYLLYDGGRIGSSRLKRSVVHIAKIMFWATLLFAVFKEVGALRHHGLYVPTLNDLATFVIFNENPFGFHLWYLGAYLYVLFLMMYVNWQRKWNLAFIAAALMLAGDILFYLLLCNNEIQVFAYRNFLGIGLPYFVMGIWIKRNTAFEYKTRSLLFLFILFSITSIAERSILAMLDANPAREYYISTTFLAVVLFMLFLSFKQEQHTLISKLGEKYSLYIYIFHPLFLMCFRPIIQILPAPLATIYYCTAPFIILSASVMFTMALKRLKLVP